MARLHPAVGAPAKGVDRHKPADCRGALSEEPAALSQARPQCSCGRWQTRRWLPVLALAAALCCGTAANLWLNQRRAGALSGVERGAAAGARGLVPPGAAVRAKLASGHATREIKSVPLMAPSTRRPESARLAKLAELTQLKARVTEVELELEALGGEGASPVAVKGGGEASRAEPARHQREPRLSAAAAEISAEPVPLAPAAEPATALARQATVGDGLVDWLVAITREGHEVWKTLEVRADALSGPVPRRLQPCLPLRSACACPPPPRRCARRPRTSSASRAAPKMGPRRRSASTRERPGPTKMKSPPVHRPTRDGRY